LTPDGIILNDEEIKGTEESQLSRGDLISVGENKLRFIAPGEVFTLREEVADRVIDRQKSRLPLILGGAALVLSVIFAGIYFTWEGALSDQKAKDAKAAKATKKETQALIAELLREGDKLYKAGSFIEPVGDNALQRFRDVLDLNPNNNYAKRRIADIKERAKSLGEEKRRLAQSAQKINKILADADRYFEAGNYISPRGRNARAVYGKVLELDPKNDRAIRRLAEIELLLGDIVERVETLLQRATGYISLGQYIEPPKESAYALIKEVFKFDPENESAKALLIEMAARSILEGDQEKFNGQPTAMKRAYFRAETIGVDPEFLSDRQKGANLIRKSRASIVIYDRKSGKENASTTPDSKYLNTQKIKRKIASLELKGEAGRRRTIFIDLKKLEYE